MFRKNRSTRRKAPALAGAGLLATTLMVFSHLSGTAYAQAGVEAAAPRELSASPEETAWRLFIDAMRPSGRKVRDARLNWETWIEQECLYAPATTPGCPAPGEQFTGSLPPEQRFHKSILHAARAPDGIPGAPPNFAGCQNSKESGRSICEEARLNPVAARYVGEHNLADRAIQAKFAAKPGIDFPPQAVETKVDWVHYNGTCAEVGEREGSLAGVYTEQLVENGKTQCYALAGVHLNSKLLPNWVWATFEPQNKVSNPRRCVVLGCRDSFGSNPAVTPPLHPFPTKMTDRLRKLMVDAKLDPVFQNYRLDGVQTIFTDAGGKPALLGNSIIEAENGGIPLEHASCITCHSASSIAVTGEDGLSLLKNNPIGPRVIIPVGFNARDFVWSLFLAPAGTTQSARTGK